MRYVGTSPFQTTGLVWASGFGQLLAADGLRQFYDKPDLSFDFDAHYCEPTLCHRVVDGADEALTAEQIANVETYIATELAKPRLVHGVDADGIYVGIRPEDQVHRVVGGPPPPAGTWALDLSRSTGDHWLQAHCVDAAGAYVGNVDEPFAVVPEPAATETYGQIWRWDFNAKRWHDARSDADKLAAARELKTNEAWALSQQRFAESTVSVSVNGALHTYGCDPITRENITAINTAISRAPHLVPSPRPYTPKGGSPVMTTHEEFLAIYLAGLAKGDAFYQAYYAHKTAILALETVDEVMRYEVEEGWPA